MVKKRDVIESERQLFEMIGKPADPVVCSDDVRNCIGMCTHYCITSNVLLWLIIYFKSYLLIRSTSMDLKCPSIRPSDCPQKVSLIIMKFGM